MLLNFLPSAILIAHSTCNSISTTELHLWILVARKSIFPLLSLATKTTAARPSQKVVLVLHFLHPSLGAVQGSVIISLHLEISSLFKNPCTIPPDSQRFSPKPPPLIPHYELQNSYNFSCSITECLTRQRSYLYSIVL